MSAEIQNWLGLYAACVSAAGYLHYLWAIYKHKAKPHMFSWAVWAIILWIVFCAQSTEGAAAGAWATIVSAIFCSLVTVLAFFKGEKNITKGDWISLSSALATIVIWRLTQQPLLAVVLSCAIDAFAFYPTVRKSYKRPHEESMIIFLASSIKWIFSLLALQQVSLVTGLYPAYAFFTNAAVYGMLWHRRRIIRRRRTSRRSAK